MATNLRSIKANTITPVIVAAGVSSGVKITTLSPSILLTSGSQTITVSGSGFNSGAVVYVDANSCSTTFVNSTSLTFTSPAKSIGSYHLYVYNTDGSAGVKPNGAVYSTAPIWLTPSGALTGSGTNVSYSQSVSATSDSAITYTLTGGSLPTGFSLNSSNGAITGTTTTTGTSSFTITATDGEGQTANRSFSIQVDAHDFTISPAVGGKTSWTFATDGNLTITTPGEYTIVPSSGFTKVVKMWGAGGKPSTAGSTSWGGSGAGGAGTGTVTFSGGVTHLLRVGNAGSTGTPSATAYGAGAGGTSSGGVGLAGSGGGYTGIFRTSVTQGNAVLMAGGGGGGAANRSDGLGGRFGAAGGGTAGQTTGDLCAQPGTQGGGGAAQGGGSPTSGSALQGGGGDTTQGAGGGGGYFGGGGGGQHGDGGYGGGAGSGYYNATYVTSATLYTGSFTTPGNNTDADRPTNAGNGATSGGSGVAGAIVIKA